MFSISLKFSADALVSLIIWLGYLKYVPGQLEILMKRKTVVVLYVTIILHVHGSPGKQTDEWYRMTCDPDIGCSI